MTLIMFSATFYGQDISNLEKSKLEDTVKQIVMTEVSKNPAFKDFRITNSTPVKFEKRIAPKNKTQITDTNQIGYGVKEGDIMSVVTFYDSENHIIIESSVLLRNSTIVYVLRGDMIILSGDVLLNLK